MTCDAFALVTPHRIAPRRYFTLVLEHALTRRERTNGEHAFAVNCRPPDNHAPHTLSFPDVSASIRAANFRIQCDGMSTRLPRSGTGGHIEARSTKQSCHQKRSNVVNIRFCVASRRRRRSTSRYRKVDTARLRSAEDRGKLRLMVVAAEAKVTGHAVAEMP
jgi:hypothetical protein